MAKQAELDGMLKPAVLRRVACDGRCVVYDFDVADTGMRDLAVVVLTDAGRSVTEVAAVFGLTATYVSMLRGRARRHGSAVGPPTRPGAQAQRAAGGPGSALGPARDVPRPGSRPGTGWPGRW